MSVYRVFGDAFSSYFIDRVLLADPRVAADFRFDADDLRRAARLVRDARKILAHREQQSSTETQLLRPLADIAGWSVSPDSDTIKTLHGDENGGFALTATDGSIWGRAFCAGPADDLDAAPRGHHRRFALSKTVERVLEATNLGYALVLNRSELRIVRRSEGGTTSGVAFNLDALAEWGVESERGWRLLLGFTAPTSQVFPLLLDRVVEFGHKEMVGVGTQLGRQVAEAAAGLVRGLYAIEENRERLPVAGDDAALYSLFGEVLRTLYRALFALFAEARGLLPIDLPLYRDNYALSTSSDAPTLGFAARTRALFDLLRRGADFGGGERIAAFGGALFAPGAAPLVDSLIWDDVAVKTALIKLTRIESRRGTIPVSYRELDEERLGSIYEGLLELRLQVADRVMERVRVGGRELVLDPEALKELDGYAFVDESASAADLSEMSDDPETTEDDEEAELDDAVSEAPTSKMKRVLVRVETIARGTPYLASSSGRKDTASYYTARDLVDFLVRETIDPKAVDAAPSDILALRVVDPAMGSGHFLIGAMRRLADHLLAAYRRVEEEGDVDALPMNVQCVWESEPALLALCRQLVAVHCIFGVDKNPLAVDLARVALWLATAAVDHPLSFLDHRLRCGDALLGLPVRDVLSVEGLGPRPKPAKKNGRASSKGAHQYAMLAISGELVDERALEAALAAKLLVAFRSLRGFLSIVDDDDEPFETKCKAADIVRDVLADLGMFHAARVGRLLIGDKHDAALIAALSAFAKLRYLSVEEKNSIAPLVAAAERQRAFCWELEFPDVYFEAREDGEVVRRKDAGFDVVLGNPPWDKLKIEERTWYSRYDPLLADFQGRGAVHRIALIDAREPTSRERYAHEVQELVAYVSALNQSGSYGWQSVKVDGRKTGGDPDTFKYFTERDWSLAQPQGAVGVVVPAALTSGDGTTGLRCMLFEHASIRSLIVFENRKGLFPIDSRFKFSTVVFDREGSTSSFRAAFWQHETDVLRASGAAEEKLLYLHVNDIRKSSPARLALLEVRSAADLEIAKRVLAVSTPLGEVAREYGATFGSELHMSQDAKLFRERDALTRAGARRDGDVWNGHDGERYLPLREGRMVQAFDANAKRYERGAGRSAMWSENGFPKKPIEPHYWVRESVLAASWNGVRRKLYWCDVTGATNERTAMAALVTPPTVGTESVRAIYFPNNGGENICAVFNSFVFDWYMRMMVSQHLSNHFVEPAPFLRDFPLTDISGSVTRLSSPDADYCERADVRAELDAAVALGFELSYDDLAHVLRSFPLLDREEPPLDSETRSSITVDLVLAAYVRRSGFHAPHHADRVRAARSRGALGYVAAPLRKLLPNSRKAGESKVLMLGGIA